MLASGSTDQSLLPTTGMRGGLGRTLLTAFLVLAIVPLSAISWYATLRERYDVQREVTAKLSAVEVQGHQWVGRRVASLAFLAAFPATKENLNTLVATLDSSNGPGETSANITADADAARDALYLQLQSLLSQDPVFCSLAVLDRAGEVLVSAGLEGGESLLGQMPVLETGQGAALQSAQLDPNAEAWLVIAQRVVAEDGPTIGFLAGQLCLDDLIAYLQTTSHLGETGEIYLVDGDGMAWPQRQVVSSPGIDSVLAGEDAEGLYDNYAGVPVIGVYRWMPDLGLALVVEQNQDETFATADSVTATVVGASLAVALATAVIAAVVTRQITQPIVRLTKSALNIAEGDLDQQVPVKSRDEIGILAYVFNRMAADLKALYEDLEEKVAQRTALLQSANYQIQRRAIQMQASVEVGQAVTSILDSDQLLEQVVRVVRSRFVYSRVAVYTANGKGDLLHLRACVGEAESSGPSGRFYDASVPVDVPGPVGKAFREGETVVETHPIPITVGPPASYVSSEIALPLRLGDRILGVLDVQSTDEEGVDEDDVSVLQNVASQITIALENARAYAVEREAVERLKDLDQSKRRFLSNMSHEFRTPLTNILGFSRLMLKGISGPLTEQQQDDLQIVYQDSQHLLGLINDLLDISHIEAGLMELEFQEVDLVQLIHSVMATVSALVRDREVELHQEIAPDIPMMKVDVARIRQVLLRLLANAAKFTEEGVITVRAWPTDGEVRVSVSDTGVGILPEDRERIFRRFEQGTMENGRRPDGAGLGLALSKEFVEMHGGRIWVESEVGKGSTFTFSLPLSRE
ncbi:MAG: GAF domain-containing protein [Anaerolineae bacterium]|nr:GAF domain-containing protein [Anaerolineae bacterium]